MSVYLVHFEQPIGNPASRHGTAQHYIGWTGRRPVERLADHEGCRGSRITAEVARRGIGMRIVRVWEGAGRDFERRLKNRKNARQLCPVCRGEA